MKQIIRILISGLIAGFIALGILELDIVQAMLQKGMLSHLPVNHELMVFSLAFVLIFFTVSIPFASKLTVKLEHGLSKYPMQEILMYIIGLGIGLYVANLLESAFITERNSAIGNIFKALLYFGLGFFGMHLVHLKKDEIKGWVSKKGEVLGHSCPKILDTSVIIDGRILDIINTGIIEGKILIPTFVLDELRHIADLADPLKRARGRRGLDLLNEIKNTKQVTVEIIDVDYSDLEEVDSKLLKLARQIQGKVVTNDFNLNKVAKLQHVPILNINDLANAIKQVVLPNEEMTVAVVKAGKEPEQGVAYLNDGTMIVVEGGRKYLGNTIKINVTTVLQTSAGRMIFAKVVL